jgi:hypothetical protein
MKRLNPKTGTPFSRGDIRDDGYLFRSYVHTIVTKSTGYYREVWISPKTFAKQNADMAKYQTKNAEQTRIRNRAYVKRHPDRANAKTARRRAARRQGTPLSLTLEQHKQIKLWYTRATKIKKFTGEIWHVDHIVPIRGEFVSGLHVPWNLQLLPAFDNCSKGNRINLT